MTLKTNTFEGGAAAGGNGTAITTGNSGGASGDAFQSTAGTPIVFSTEQAYDGSYSVKFVSGAAASVRWESMNSNTLRASAYFRTTASQTGVREIIQVRTGAGGQIANIAINASNQLQALHNGGTTSIAGSVSGALTNNNWYRVDVIFIVNTSNANQGRIMYRLCNVQAGDNNTAIHSYDSGATLTMGTTNLGRIYFGITSDTTFAGSLYMDSIRVDDTPSSTTFLDGLYVATPITTSLTPNMSLLEADDGTPPFTIAQDSGDTFAPIELDDGTVSGTGAWLVAQHASDTRTYTVTDSAAVESTAYNVPPISPANSQRMRPDPLGSSTDWV